MLLLPPPVITQERSEIPETVPLETYSIFSSRCYLLTWFNFHPGWHCCFGVQAQNTQLVTVLFQEPGQPQTVPMSWPWHSSAEHSLGTPHKVWELSISRGNPTASTLHRADHKHFKQLQHLQLHYNQTTKTSGKWQDTVTFQKVSVSPYLTKSIFYYTCRRKPAPFAH